MGCWNGTCGITQMPIVAGERVALIFLLENKYSDHGGSGFCYSNNQYSPITMPIFGEYNDYGAIDKIDKKNRDIVFNHLITLIDNKTLIIKDDDNDVTEKPKDYEELFDILHNCRLRANDGNGAVGFMIIHENVYKALVDEMGDRSIYKQYWNYKTKLKMAAEQHLIESDKKAQEIEQLKHTIEELEAAGENVFFLKKSLYNSEFEFAMEDNYKNTFTAQFSGYRKSMIKYYIVLLRKTKNKVLMETLVDFALFYDAMEFGRKMWIPQCGAGSQSQDYGIHQTIAKCINEQIEKVKKEYQEDNEDYTEEDLENCIKDNFF